jgi:3-oxoacyl-[acyl-carrier-protein] synthase-3
MEEMQVVIEGTGFYLPERVLTNDDLSKMVDTSDEWIRTRTGIVQRHIAAAEEACSDLAAHAAQQAIQDAHLQSADVDAVLVATVTPDMPFPSTAALLQAKLGLRCVMALDINAACSGFLYGLELARHLLHNPCYRHVLLIGSDKLSSIVNWSDRRTCVLFGDGAGAFILGKTALRASDGACAGNAQGKGCLIDCVLGADGSNPEWLCMPAGGSRQPATAETVHAQLHTIHMNGGEVFKAAVRRMAE